VISNLQQPAPEESADDESHGMERQETGRQPEDDEQQPQTSTSGGKARRRTAASRTQRPCPVDGCSSVNTDLRKHLKCCHRTLSAVDVDELVKERLHSLVESHKGQTRRRAASTRYQKPCPVSGCSSVNTDLRKHLVCCHRALTTEEIDQLVKSQPRRARAVPVKRLVRR
jgi:hypothetical protein